MNKRDRGRSIYLHDCKGFPVVRVPLHSSGKYFSFWHREKKKKENLIIRNSWIFLVGSNSVETTSEGNLPRKRASASEQNTDGS